MKKSEQLIRLLIPTGRMRDSLESLMTDCGFGLKDSGRNYRPQSLDADLEIKMLKPKNIAKLVELGRHDLGFSGRDWIAENKAKVEILFDLGLEPVKLVLAAPQGNTLSKLKKRKNLVLATEYTNIAQSYLKKKNLQCTILGTSGTTEVYPPDDADLIIDNTATGSTLRANNLEILDVIMESSTCFVGNKNSLKDARVRKKADQLVQLMKGALEARSRVMLEMNVEQKKLESILKILPSMKNPTVQSLAKDKAYAVKTVVKKEEAPGLINLLKEMGATDIVEMSLRKVLP